MTYQEHLVSVLSEPDHIRTALEIYKAMPEVYIKLQAKFWETTHQIFLSRRNEKPLWGNWEIITSYKTENPTKNYLGIECHPVGAQTFYVVMQPEGGRLFVGLYLMNEKKLSDERPPEVSKLIAALEQEQYQDGGEDCLGFKWVADKISDNMNNDVFLIDMATDPNLAAEKAIQPLLDLLQHAPEIEAAEQAMHITKPI